MQTIALSGEALKVSFRYPIASAMPEAVTMKTP